MNKVILMGRFTKDPEIKYTSNNTAICSFTLAVDRRFQKQGEDKQADFIGCQAWDKTAEFIGKYFQKGSKIGICGRIQTRTWDDNDGKKHYVTEVVVEEAYFVEGKKDSGDAPAQGNSKPSNSNDSTPPWGNQQQQQQSSPGKPPWEV